MRSIGRCDPEVKVKVNVKVKVKVKVKNKVKVKVKVEVKVEVKVTVGVENLKVVKTHQNRCGISVKDVILAHKHLFDLFY